MTRKLLTLLAIFSAQLLWSQTDFSTITQYYQKEKNFNGAVLVATNGKIDYLAGIGLANRQNQERITANTKFKIASITKTFTAVLILQLYEQGKLD